MMKIYASVFTVILVITVLFGVVGCSNNNHDKILVESDTAVNDIVAEQKPADIPSAKLTSEEISEKCSPAVFYIEIYGFNGDKRGSGSGFFIDPTGLAITNYHVVANSIYCRIITVDGNIYENVSIIDCDKEHDIALLKIEGANFPYLEMGNSSNISQGQQVYAIGSPLGLSNTMSKGIISNVSRKLDGVEYIQISVPIDHGSSGGALIDEQGKVIGVTSAGFESAGDLNLAMPVNVVNNLNTKSTADYTLWSDVYYPGFSNVLDFGAFSGLKLVTSKNSMISFNQEFDISDFHSVGPYDASSCYAYTMFYYEKALEEKGMVKNIVNNTELEFKSADEIIYIKSDFDTQRIIISVTKTLVFYDEYPSLLDFGWYSYIPMKCEPYQIDASLMYSYEWIDYYTKTNFTNILNSYFDILKQFGYVCMSDSIKDGSTIYLFEDNGISIGFIYTDSELYIDVAKMENINNNYSSNQSYPVNGIYISTHKIISTSFPLYLFANDGTGTFLGNINSNKFDSDSIANEFGNYGNQFDSKSIFNQFGTYGSKFSQYSAFNEFATKPPKILDKNGKVVGYLTTNQYISGAVSYEEMIVLLKKFNK